MDITSEKTVWQFFIGGDLNAFSTIFKTYYPQLHNYGLRISNNIELTEDCLQDFFVYLYEHRQALGKVNCIKSYLFVSFRRAIIKSAKQDILFESISENDGIFIFSAEEIRINEELSAQKAKLLGSILNGLSTREREVIYLKFYSNLKTDEITEVMGISYQSVLNTLQKAFVKLRNTVETAVLRQVLK
tara:strand:+ start:1365 stop:1928 length:564 start_codon:yes stop_codon:yes gene_type:complete